MVVPVRAVRMAMGHFFSAGGLHVHHFEGELQRLTGQRVVAVKHHCGTFDLGDGEDLLVALVVVALQLTTHLHARWEFAFRDAGDQAFIAFAEGVGWGQGQGGLGLLIARFQPHRSANSPNLPTGHEPTAAGIVATGWRLFGQVDAVEDDLIGDRTIEVQPLAHRSGRREQVVDLVEIEARFRDSGSGIDVVSRVDCCSASEPGSSTHWWPTPAVERTERQPGR